MKRRGRQITAAAGVLSLALALPAALLAQDGGGVALTFGLDTRVVYRTNPDLTPGNSGSGTTESNTRLTFGLVSATPQATFTLDAATRLRYGARVTNGQTGLADPSFRIGYARSSAAASFEASASLTRVDLAQDSTVDEFEGANGTRTTRGADLALRWGEDRRVGFGLTGALRDVTYTDAPGEVDYQRLTLGASMRLDLSEVTALTIGLTEARYDPATGDTRDTTGLNATLSLARPNGAFTLTAGADDTPEGTRARFSLGRSIELPTGSLSAEIGVTRGTSGGAALTGALGYAQELPNGQLTANLSRSVQSSEDADTETRVTRASIGYSRGLGDRTRLSLDMGLAESRETATDTRTRNGNAGATVSYDLGQDWVLDGGVRYRLREETGLERARDTSVFLGLRKTVERFY